MVIVFILEAVVFPKLYSKIVVVVKKKVKPDLFFSYSDTGFEFLFLVVVVSVQITTLQRSQSLAKKSFFLVKT